MTSSHHGVIGGACLLVHMADGCSTPTGFVYTRDDTSLQQRTECHPVLQGLPLELRLALPAGVALLVLPQLNSTNLKHLLARWLSTRAKRHVGIAEYGGGQGKRATPCGGAEGHAWR